ncbi:hypothetical protein JCM11251_005161 [Rhodosporidiobolus azoricus]
MSFASSDYKADPFPLPRYSSPPSWSPESFLPRLLDSHHSDSPPTSPSPASPPGLATPPFHPTSHLRVSSSHIPPSHHPSFLHLLHSRLSRSRLLLAESRAEALEAFPDASGATRTQPFLRGECRRGKAELGIRVALAQKKEVVAIWGDWVAVGQVYMGVGEVEVWNEREGRGGYCDIPTPFFALDICTTLCWSPDGRDLWVGTSLGTLLSFDLSPLFNKPNSSSHSSSPLHNSFDSHIKLPRTAYRQDAHPAGSPILKIAHIHHEGGTRMYTIDGSGRVVVWLESPAFFVGESPNLHGHSRVFQLDPDNTFPSLAGSSRSNQANPPLAFVDVVNGLVWAAWHLHPGANGAHKQVLVKVFDLSGKKAVVKDSQHWSTDFVGTPLLGSVTSACAVPSKPNFVFLGHASGHISLWKAKGSKIIEIVKVSLSSVTALVGPSRFLWVGYSNGIIDVLDLAHGDDWPCAWKVVKRFQAHHGPVVSLSARPETVWSFTAFSSVLRVVSVGKKVKFWDGLLQEDWLDNRMSSLVDSYCTFRPLKLGIFSWNVDGQDPDLLQSCGKKANMRLLQSFLQSLDNPDLIIFNFQELVDLSDLGLAARTALFASQNHDVTGRYHRWHKILEEAVIRHLGTMYSTVKADKLVGLYTVVFARHELRSQIRDLATHRIKSGFDEFYGNKGSLMLRLVLDNSSICLVNSHLAAGKQHHAERERDLISVLDGAKQFPKSADLLHHAYVGGGDGTAVRDCEMVFFVGDLNFRLDLPRSEVLHTLSTSSSLESAITHLMPHDELSILRQSHPSFRLRTFEEAPILFPPTYKYDHGTDVYDSSAKQRTPSWCDRVLWRAQRQESVKCIEFGRYEADISDHRPIAALFEVQIKQINKEAEQRVYRQVTVEWEREAAALLKTARSQYPRES